MFLVGHMTNIVWKELHYFVKLIQVKLSLNEVKLCLDVFFNSKNKIDIKIKLNIDFHPNSKQHNYYIYQCKMNQSTIENQTI